MENVSQMSLLEAAIKFMEGTEGPQNINKIVEEALTLKGIDKEDKDSKALLYVDITTSAKFVYLGDENWDLKSRQSLDEWDKDGSAFNTADLEDDDDDIDVDDYSLDDDKKQNDDDEDDEDRDYEDEESGGYDNDYLDSDEDDDSGNDEYDSIRDNPDDDESFDEDEYDSVMDDYEDLYDDNK